MVTDGGKDLERRQRYRPQKKEDTHKGVKSIQKVASRIEITITGE